MDKTTIERADELISAAVKAEREKALDLALSLFQQAIECYIHFVNCEWSDSDEFLLVCVWK